MPKKTHAFNVLMDPDDVAHLNALKEKTGMAGGLVIRTALRYLYQMHVTGIPTCANGAQCFVPQMHAGRIGAASPSPGIPL